MTSCISASEAKKAARLYLGAGIFLGLFSFVYSRFSHGVSSPFMTFLCLFPLVLGFVPACAALLTGRLRRPSELSLDLYRAGIWTLTAASLTRGILTIAGTSSVFQRLLMGLGLMELAAGLVLFLASLPREKGEPGTGRTEGRKRETDRNH